METKPWSALLENLTGLWKIDIDQTDVQLAWKYWIRQPCKDSFAIVCPEMCIAVAESQLLSF